MISPAEPVAFHLPDQPDVEGFLDDVRSILSTGRLGHGPFKARLEREASGLLGGGTVIAVTNCSSGLIAALSVAARTDPELGAGDGRAEVIIPSYTYLATWQAAGWAGLAPVVVDVDDHGLLDPAAAAQAVTPRTRAILGVHLLGQPADLVGLRSVADRHGLMLAFDSAHALGARWAERPVGAGGDIEVFSLGPTKQIGGSDGGLIVINRPHLVEPVLRFVNQGHVLGELDAIGPGLNLGLSEMSAALALRALPDLERRIARRAEIHARYVTAWAELPLRLPATRPGERSAFKDEVLWLDDAADRDPLRERLYADGIQTKAYYDPAIPDLTAFRGRVESAVNGRRLAKSGFAVPIHGRLLDEDVERITRSVRGFWS